MTLANPRDFERGSAWAGAARWGVAMLAIAAAHAGAAWFLVHMPRSPRRRPVRRKRRS